MFKSSLSYDYDDSGEANIIYYNCDIISSKSSDSAKDPQIRFSETRQTPIISDCSKYYMSIVRFTMDGPGSDLPLFIPSIQEGQNNPNLTVYSITLSAIIQGLSFVQQTYVEYQTESYNYPVPVGPLNQPQDLSTKYYYVYTYNRFVDLVNQTFVSCMAALQAQINAHTWNGPTPVIKSKPPRMVYNASSGLFSIYFDSWGFGDNYRQSGTGPNAEQMGLYFNSNMYQLFRNFNNIYYSNGYNDHGKTNYIIVSNNLGNNIYVDNSDVNKTQYYVMTQDFPSTDSIWSPIGSIVFTTSLIPMLPEQSAVPVLFGENNINGNGSSISNFTNIITDTALPLNGAHDYKGFIEFAANPYRLTCLSNSKQEVRSIDVIVYWKHKLTGVLYPLTMPNLSCVSLKIMFRKKSLLL